MCVVIHDVAPATWPDCLRLLQAVREVADIPLTWLVVPRWHGSAARSPALEAALGHLLADRHEMALHGYTHLDTAARANGWRSRFLRGVYTEGEGEFAALDVAEARRRIARGLAWFDQRRWPVSGFVAPAWLLGDGAWEAVRGHPFVYTTTWRHFHCLMPTEAQSEPAEPGPHQAVQRQRRLPPLSLNPLFPRWREPKFAAPAPQRSEALHSPSLVYAARNRTGRIVSPPAARMLATLLRDAPLVRLALHPRDAHHPALLRHAQKLIEHLLQSRVALTKAGFASQWLGATSTAPNTRPATSASAPAPRSSADSHSAADRRAR
nr:polysaccharide deacetylase family protein [Massilia mucilaginosa]